MDIAALAELIGTREVSPVAVVESSLARIELLEPRLHAFIGVDADAARKEARQAEADLRAGGSRGALHGIPFAVKDVFDVRGDVTTGGCKALSDRRAPCDADVVALLRRAGAIVVGKLNLQQFAYGPLGENPDFGNMGNPWNDEYIAGGSSGGSAAAVAGHEIPFALGTDTGGSIRLPASLCNLVGLKPTYGLVSRRGVMPLSWSMDCPGPVTRTVLDAAMVLNVLADGRIGLSGTTPAECEAVLRRSIEHVRIGVPDEFCEGPLHAEVAEAFQAALAVLEQLGATVVRIAWPMVALAHAISTTILFAEAAGAFEDTLGVHGPEITDSLVKLRIEAGLLISATEYLKAQRARALFVQESHDLFEEVDIVAGPTVPIRPVARGTTHVAVGGASVSVMDALTKMLRPFNTNGFPAMTMPCGFTEDGMPLGLQLAARPYDEMSLLRVGFAYQNATDWHRRKPTVAEKAG